MVGQFVRRGRKGDARACGRWRLPSPGLRCAGRIAQGWPGPSAPVTRWPTIPKTEDLTQRYRDAPLAKGTSSPTWATVILSVECHLALSHLKVRGSNMLEDPDSSPVTEPGARHTIVDANTARDIDNADADLEYPVVPGGQSESPSVSTPSPAIAAAAPPVSGRLIGRAKERSVLDRFLATLWSGESQALVLLGRAGVGKTALLGVWWRGHPFAGY